MAKKKKDMQQDLRELFDKSKKRLQILAKDAQVWMKKGEVEIGRLSKMGRIEIDIVNLNVKKEQLFRNIGKKIVEGDLYAQINNASVKDMCSKAKAAIEESKKKSRVMSQIKKGFLKSKKTQAKKKK